jgi:MFS transporter, putative metabolite:H+ symporter
MQSEAHRSKSGITFHNPLAFWSGAALVTIGVIANMPMLFAKKSTNYILAGTKADVGLIIGVLMIVVGTILTVIGVAPRQAFKRSASASARVHVRIKAMDDAKLTAAHYKLMAVLAVAIAVDTLKPFTFAFILPGYSAEYGLNSPSHPAPGALPAALFPIAGITGTTIGSFLWGFLADRIGRRACILLSAITFIGTAACGAMPSFNWNMAMCFLMGLGVGGLLPISYSLLSETIPARRRGGIVVLVAGIGTALGFLIASYGADWLIPHYSWRIMWFLGFPTGLVLIAINHFIPESPRFLLANGYASEARVVMRNFGAVAVEEQPDEQEPVSELAAFKGEKFHELFRRPLGGLTLGVTLYGLAWGLVNFGFITWLPSNLAKLGLSLTSITALIAKAALFSIPGAVLVAYLYDRWSSKKTMVLFSGITAATLAAFAVLGDSIVHHTGILTFLVICLLVSMWAVISVLSPYSAEVYPTKIRASGAGVAAGASKLGGVMALVMAALAISPPSVSGSAILVAIPCALAAVVIAVKGIETRGRRLEEIHATMAAASVRVPAPLEPVGEGTR